MLENRKPPTDFTIDCILSKNDREGSDLPRLPTSHPLNKVLDNNPWISKYPLALTFNPSYHRKLNLPPSPITPVLQPNFFNISTINYTENILNVTQNFTAVHNHFYPASTTSESTSNSDDFKLLPKFETGSLSDEKSSSDSDSLSLSENHAVDLVTLSPKSAFKCSVCSKSFENCELLDVGWRYFHVNWLISNTKKILIRCNRFTKNVIWSQNMSVQFAVKSFPNFETSNITCQFIVDPKNLQQIVQSAEKLSMTKDIWVVIWKFIGELCCVEKVKKAEIWKY